MRTATVAVNVDTPYETASTTPSRSIDTEKTFERNSQYSTTDQTFGSVQNLFRNIESVIDSKKLFEGRTQSRADMISVLVANYCFKYSLEI